MAQRTLPEKVADIKTTYHQFAEWLTTPDARAQVEALTGPEAREAVATAGDVRAYAEVVRASIDVQRMIAANDRAALMAAVMANGGSPARVVADDTEG